MAIGQLASFVLCVVAVVLCSLACAGNDWIKVTGDDNFEATIGLWKVCVSIDGGAICKSLTTEGAGFYNACRAMSVIAVIIAGVAALGYAVAWLAPDSTVGTFSGMPYISGGMLFISGMLSSFQALI